MLTRWGFFVSTHRRAVLALSGLGLALSIFALIVVAPTLSTEGFVEESAESAQVERLVAEEFGRGDNSLVFLFDTEASVTDPSIQARIESALAPLMTDAGVNRVLTTWSTGNPGFISADGASTYAVALLNGHDAEHALALVDQVREGADAQGLTVGVTGLEPVNEAVVEGVERGLIRAELVSIPLTIIILLIVFGGLVAAGIPLFVGTMAILGAMSVIFLLSNTMEQSVFAINMITMLGLALGIDYSLFMVSRFREEVRQRPIPEALAVTMGTVGKAVLFAGLTVIFGLAATQFFPLPAVRSLGQAGMIVTAMALLYGLTFLPALMATLGGRINAVPIGRLRLDQGSEGGFWHLVAVNVMRRPVAVLMGVLAVLLLAGIPFLRLDLTPGGVEVLPATSEPRVVSERLRSDFPSDEAEPITVVATFADDTILTPDGITALQTLTTDLAALPGVTRVDSLVTGVAATTSGYDWSGFTGDVATLPAALQQSVGETIRGDQALIQISHTLSSKNAESLVRDVRDRSTTDLSLQVGGVAATSVDTVDAITGAVIPALLFVLIGSYFILLFTFGSVFLPLKAMFATMLSISASLGIVVLVFQEGWLSGLLNFTATGEIVAITPILMFCILFGLGMDYEVLMLSRIQEEYQRTRDNTASVAYGLEHTAKVITAAAAIMIVVFGGFILADIVIIKSMGFGLALAVLIDATIVRGLLVPSAMRLMGRWTWWAPAPVTALVNRVGLGHGEVVALPTPIQSVGPAD